MKAPKSPFKFLDAYEKKDAAIFFGRTKETEALYDALSGVKLLLVNGPSGAGKTSLIECGLRNQFSNADWFALTIRKGNNISASVYDVIHQSLHDKFELDAHTNLPKDNAISFGKAIELLFEEKFKPVFLLFDQFEELLISGKEKEISEFFERLHALINYKVPVRVILIMREEFVGHLSKYEHLCPSLFDHRFRLEKMTQENVRSVLQHIFSSAYYLNHFSVEEADSLTNLILKKLPDQQNEIELAHVQVFLSELWDRADHGRAEKPNLYPQLVKEKDHLEGVLESFLKKQLKELDPIFPDNMGLEVLAIMISGRATKLQLSVASIQDELSQKGLSFDVSLQALLDEFLERRILRTLKVGDETQYEISHDILAAVVGNNITEEMQLREKARQIYSLYMERAGLFSKSDLDQIRPFQSYAPYPMALARRMEESEVKIKEEEDRERSIIEARAKKEQDLREQAEYQARRASNRSRIAAFVAVLAIVAAALAGNFYTNAQTALNAKVRQEKIGIARELMQYAASYEDLDKPEKALELYQRALDSLKAYPDEELYLEISQKLDP